MIYNIIIIIWTIAIVIYGLYEHKQKQYRLQTNITLCKYNIIAGSTQIIYTTMFSKWWSGIKVNYMGKDINGNYKELVKIWNNMYIYIKWLDIQLVEYIK